jgi:anti-anti-sigma factor
MAYLIEESIDGIAVLRIRGSLTADGMDQIERRFDELARAKGVCVIADLARVEALTTPAITLMLRASRAIEHAGGKMVFANPRPAIARMFACCRLDAVLTFAGDMDIAVRLARCEPSQNHQRRAS